MPSLSTPATEGDSPVPPTRHQTDLITILFTDLVGSTALKQQVGDRTGATLIQQHHGLVRELLRGFKGGEEIETAGDSFLILFTRPSDAVHFGLLLHARLRAMNQGLAARLEDRIGIHVGEVVIWEQDGSSNPKELTGVQVDTCARVMGLAQGGQILLTRSAFDSARQMLKGEDIPGVGPLGWLNHGSYLLKGIEASFEVCEVGEVGIAPLQAPAGSEKAQRQVTLESEPVLGWRPAVGQLVPNTRWRLESKLGEGGFGEVWLGRNTTTKQASVFKFCFQAERVRFLKRELTLFRLLKERVGGHPNIVAIHDVYLDQPPFYVEMEHVEGKDLRSWCEDHGGVAGIPVETRLEMVAQAADALQAAHDAGIIHRDVKPANILIGGKGTGATEARVKITDFGIGQVVSEESLKGITKAGFTKTILPDSSSSRTGTQLYTAPEVLAGKPASTRSDIYSLGVVLYQLLIGDFSRPLTTDWANEIPDPLLREDLKHCFAGNPRDRFAGAGQMAKDLRALPERRAALQERLRLERAALRRRAISAVTAGVATVLLLLGVALGYGLRRAERARIAASQSAYAAHMHAAQADWDDNNMAHLRQVLGETLEYSDRGFEWYYWQQLCHLELRTLRGHAAFVSRVAYSPDGQRMVTGSEDRTAKVWESSNGRELFTLKGHRESVRSLAFSPDGQRIVTGSMDFTAKVWDANSGRELHTLTGHKAGIISLAFSSDGQRLVTGSDDQTARVWEVSTGQPLMTLPGHEGNIDQVRFSSDGHRILTEERPDTAKVWDATTGRLLLALRGHPISFSADGRQIAMGSSNSTAKVWEASTGRELQTLTGHTAEVASVAFSPDGRRILTGSGDETAKLWESSSGRQLLTLKGHTVSIWGLSALPFSPDGQRIVTVTTDGFARFWEAETGRELLALKGPGAPSFSPNGQWIVAQSGNAPKVWDARKQPGLLVLPGHTKAIRALAFSPDGQRLVTGSDDHTGKVWEVATGRELLALKGHQAQLTAVAFSPDGQEILTGSQDNTARLWDANSGRERLKIQGHRGGILSAAFSPKGERIVTGSSDRTARVWETAIGHEVLTLSNHTHGVSSVAYSPDGRRIVTGSWDRTAKLWNAATGHELRTLRGHGDMVTSAAFSPDGRYILTGSKKLDPTARLWEAASGIEVRKLGGHGGSVRSVAFSADARRILTGSEDRTARLWEASTGRELLTLRGQVEIKAVAFSPDGQRIATGNQDGTVTVWTRPPERQVTAWIEEERLAQQRLAALELEQTRQAQSERAVRARDPGAIRRWLILAPIPLEARHYGGPGLDHEQLPGEANLRPRAGEKALIGAREFVWDEHFLPDYVIDFNQVLGETGWGGDVSDHSVAYAVCYILAEKAQTGLVMRIGSDDEAKVYLNGTKVYECRVTSRVCIPDSDEVRDIIQFKQGLNVLVFKVVNEEGPWGGCLRFTDGRGNPVKGVKVTLDPEAKD